MGKINSRLIVLSVFVSLIACSAGSSLLRPVAEDALKLQSSGRIVTLDTLKTGFRLYVDHCSGCHNLHVPKEKTKEHWEAVFPEMFLRTKLSVSQHELVKIYVYSKL